ncbi:MAG: amidohydrolase, partial [Dehalococcoidales bacterium]|nr:amidohydrolase [Dehalococcoidales bacterium]
YLAEKRHPTRWEIDEVAPEHPVVLSHRSLHGCVLNSRALALAGITTATPEPPGAMIGRRAEDGEPNGFLVEMLGYIREKVMPPISAEELDKGIVLANRQYLSQGLTSLQDATFVNDLKRWHYYKHFKEHGLLGSRVYMMTGVEELQVFQDAGLSFGSGDEYLRLGAIKIIPSLVSDKLYPSQEELNEMVLDAHRAGFQVACHAVQMELLNAVISTYEYLKKHSPDFGTRRHRMEHCSECTPQMVQRIKRLQLTVVTHPSYAYYNGDRYLATVSPDIVPFLYPLKSLVDAGIVTAGASDSPVVPSNPLMGIYGAITRQTSSGNKMVQKEGVTAVQALALYTINAAYASHEEKIKGSITPGKLADMVLLSDDPTKVSPEKIKDIKVRMTVIGGKVVWEA